MIVNGDLDVTGNIDMLGTTSFKIASSAKLYLDGGGDTYFVESASNTVDLYTNGAIAWTTNTTGLTLGSGLDLTILTTKKLKFNVGGTAYIYESAANVVDIYGNSNKLITFNGSTSFVSVNTGVDFSIAATKKLYLDGGTNTYIYESAADTVGLYTNATLALQASTTLVSIGSARDLAVTAAKKIFLDGGGDTYWIETSANTAEIFTGGTRRATFGSSGISNATITAPAITTPSITGVSIFTHSGSVALLDFSNTNAGNVGVYSEYYHNSATPAVNDIINLFTFYGNDSAANKTAFGTMRWMVTDPTNGSEDCELRFTNMSGGTAAEFIKLSDVIEISRDTLPSLGNIYDLGSNALDWDNIYAVNALNVTSDKRLKTDIDVVNIGLDFINDLAPVFFKWKESSKKEYLTKKVKQRDGSIKEVKQYKKIKKTDSEKRFHAGFIAQDVEKVLEKHKVDFGVLCYDKESDKYTMRPEELLPVLTKAIQELSSKIDALEKKAKK